MKKKLSKYKPSAVVHNDNQAIRSSKETPVE